MSNTSVKDVAKKALKSKAQLKKEEAMAEEMSQEELDVPVDAPEKPAPADSEALGEGVIATVDNNDIRVKMHEKGKKPRKEGKWIKISSKAELVKYEQEGRLVGWDALNSEVLLKD